MRFGWEKPAIPPGFDELVCCDYGNRLELDFTFSDRTEYASQTVVLDLPWPWIEGYRPTRADWHVLGIAVIDMT